MKKCRKCNKIYDDSWKICLSCNILLDNEVSQPKIVLLSSVVPPRAFDSTVKNIFMPKPDFYDKWNPSVERMLLMTADIFTWLSMDTSNIFCDYGSDMNCPGFYKKIPEGGMIFINSKYKNNPFETGAILVHECMHHYMRKHDLEIADRLENEKKTDLLTISNGLGILYINGMCYESNWGITAIAAIGGGVVDAQQRKWFGYYSWQEYCKQFVEYLNVKNIDGSDVIGVIHPKSRQFLPKTISSRKAKRKLATFDIFEKQAQRDIIAQIIALILITIIVAAQIWRSILAYR